VRDNRMHDFSLKITTNIIAVVKLNLHSQYSTVHYITHEATLLFICSETFVFQLPTPKFVTWDSRKLRMQVMS